jgi:hypothetical protein
MSDKSTTQARYSAARQRRNRTAARRVLLIATPATAVAFFTGAATGNAAAHPAAASQAPGQAAGQAEAVAGEGPTRDEPTTSDTDQIVVLDAGTFQGRHWRFVRDRFVVTLAEDGLPAQNLLTVPHLPFSQYGRPGTVACEALGYQFGHAAPGTQPDYNAGYSCTPAGQGDEFATPTQFQALGFGNESDKQTGAPTIMEAFGNGPAPGVAGSTAVSATLTVDGARIAHRPLVKAPGDSTSYFAFLTAATADPAPTVLVTLYDAAGRQVASLDMAPPSTGPGLAG